MFAILHALGMFVVDLFKSRTRLEAENLFLSVISSPLLCGRLHLVSDFAAVTVPCSSYNPTLAEPAGHDSAGSTGDHPAVASGWL